VASVLRWLHLKQICFVLNMRRITVVVLCMHSAMQGAALQQSVTGKDVGKPLHRSTAAEQAAEAAAAAAAAPWKRTSSSSCNTEARFSCNTCTSADACLKQFLCSVG
jgi:hypothetical protein